MRPPRRTASAFLILALAIGLALVAHVRPGLAFTLAGGAFLAGMAWTFYEHLPRIWATAMALGLLGYATLGRGFAYLGFGPTYVGEVLLATGVLVALLHGRGHALLRQHTTWLLLLMMSWGVARTVPYLGPYGLDALRDAVLWGYAAFALIIGALLRSPHGVGKVVDTYHRLMPIILVAAPIGYLLERTMSSALPTTPGSDIPLVSPKAGDLGVHLVGILAFVALGVHRAWREERGGINANQSSTVRARLHRGAFTTTWTLSILWVLAWAVTFAQRAAVVTVLVGGSLLVALRPTSGWWRPAYVAALLLVAVITFDVSVGLGGARELSAESIQIAAVSLVGSVGSNVYDGPRQWRLNWWQDIIDYAVFGPRRWAGKGYGINLANADGYQVLYDDSLRSPHNAHLNVLARGGIPGLITWAGFHLLLLAALLLAYFARHREGRDAWARLNLWLALYLLAFHVNASFDVFLEGPQGGIWFWTVVGVALASLTLQSAATRRATDVIGP